MKRLKHIHPVEILKEKFLLPPDISANRQSKDISIPQTRISEIGKVNRRRSADTVLRLIPYFGNASKFWLGLKNDDDLEEEPDQKRKDFNAVFRFNDNLL